MANTITSIMPKILAAALLALREQAVMPRLVNFNWGTETAKKGSTIDVPLPAAQAVTDVTPAAVPPTQTDHAPTTVQLVLDKWKKSNFYLTDKEIGEIDPNAAFYPMQVSEAVRGLANQVNSDVFALYKDVYGYTGTAGTTPFAIGSGNFPNSPTDAVNLRKVLNKQLAPPDSRRAVLSLDAEANALALPAFSNFEQTGDMPVKIEGRLGRKFGLDWFYDQAVPTHTTGAAGTALLDDTVARAVGLKTLHMDGFTTKPSVGDVFTIAGDTQTYVVTASTTLVGTDSDVSFEPGLQVAIPAADGNEAVTFKASHVVNLGFHRDAFAFATRPVGDMVFKGGSEILQMTDTGQNGTPGTGINLTLEVSRQHHQTSWELSILYGCKTIRRELAARLAG
jgi:hypothetical protein